MCYADKLKSRFSYEVVKQIWFSHLYTISNTDPEVSAYFDVDWQLINLLCATLFIYGIVINNSPTCWVQPSLGHRIII